MANIPTMVQGAGYKDYTSKQKLPEEAPSAPRPTGQPDAPTWDMIGYPFWERTEAPLPPPRIRCNFIHPKQLSPFPERLNLPFSYDETLSGYEDIVSSGTDQFTTWVKTDPDATLVQHMVDVQNAVAEFREASVRRPRYIFSGLPLRQKTCLIVRLCKSDSASTTGIQDLDVGRKMPLRSKSQASGMSSRHKKHLNMSIMTFLQIGST